MLKPQVKGDILSISYSVPAILKPSGKGTGKLLLSSRLYNANTPEASPKFGGKGKGRNPISDDLSQG
jgi:hypothetical protein